MLIKFGKINRYGDKEFTQFKVNSIGWLQAILQDEAKRSIRILALVQG